MKRTLGRALATEALEMALKQRRPNPGLIHHSDRDERVRQAASTPQKINEQFWRATIFSEV